MYCHCSRRILFTVAPSWHRLIPERVGVFGLSSDIWKRVSQLVPKVLVTPVQDQAGFEVQSNVWIDVPTGHVPQNDDYQFFVS